MSIESTAVDVDRYTANGTRAPVRQEHALLTLARNVLTRYILIIVNVLIGLILLPFNVRYLGEASYGLWMLTTTVAAYFMMLDLGYAGAIVKFVAEFRARKNVRALNEVLSTMAYVFSALGLLSLVLAAFAAVALPHVFNLAPEQVGVGRLILLMSALQVALYFHFSIYGGVVSGFERYSINNVVGTIFNIATAAVNVLVLWLGYGLVELVAATTAMRVAPLWFYRRNAFKVFPELRIRRSYIRRDRLRELSGFSIYLAVVDWSGRLTYTTDTFYVGIFLNTAAVGVYAVAQRLSEAVLSLTHQLHTVMMPAVVHRAVDAAPDRQQALMVRATRFQLAIAMCLAGGVAAVADVLIRTWFGGGLEGSVPVTQLLCLVAVLRAWTAMPGTVLQGTGHARYVAVASSWAAAANLILSIPFLLMWGLVGVALGTAVAAAIGAAIVFPRACRVVELSLFDGFRRIVWPTAWPAVAVVAALVLTKQSVPGGFLPVLGHLGLGGLAYIGLFFLFGIDRDERRWLVEAFNRIAGRHPERLATGPAGG